PAASQPTARFPHMVLAMSVCALAVFAGWTAYVHPGATPSPLDLSIAQRMKGFADDHPALRGLLVALTFFGSVPALAVLAGFGVTASLVAGRRELALGWLLAASG